MNTKKYFAAIISLFCAITIIISSTLVYKTGLIPDINPEIDEAKENAKIEKYQSDVVEGVFLDRNGETLTEAAGKGEAARIVYPEALSAVIGYNSKRMGVNGLRRTLYKYIYDGGKDGIGASVTLTLDSNVQNRVYKLLDGHVGSISIINASTGEIIALASRGDPEVGYNANKIDDYYDEAGKKYYSDIYGAIDEFWFNRATLAQDPPGSCAKMITAVSLVENDKADYEYNDETGNTLEHTIVNFGGYSYGKCDLQKALNNSVNTYFANAGITLGAGRLKKTFNNFMVGKTTELDFTTLKSNFINQGSDYSDFLLGSNAYGQGELVMSPLHLAMTAAAILNDGKMMKPYMVQKIENDDKTVFDTKPELLNNATDSTTAKTVQKLLSGTANSYGLYKGIENRDRVTIIAKTGTAEVADKSKGNHIYYTMGIEIDGAAFGICIDRNHVPSNETGSTLKSTAIAVRDILISEFA